MSGDQELLDHLVWATRGRSWGFRFLLNGGLSDPLSEYERVFGNVKDQPTTLRRVAGRVAFRLPDPLGRRDAAGRVIPHEFIVLGETLVEIESVEDGRDKVWALVAAAYERVWDAESPPSLEDLRLTTRGSPPLDPAPPVREGE